MFYRCPGPGVKVASLETSFKNPCPVGSQVRFSVEILRERKLIEVAFRCSDANSDTTSFMTGQAKLVRWMPSIIVRKKNVKK